MLVDSIVVGLGLIIKLDLGLHEVRIFYYIIDYYILAKSVKYML